MFLHHHGLLISTAVFFLLQHGCTGAKITNGTFCSLPPDNTKSTGASCFGILPRYFYNQTLGTCKEYTYGGCGATLNNFGTREECEEAAEMYCDDNAEDATETLEEDTTKSPSPDVSVEAITDGTFCSLPPDETSETGLTCAAYMPKYYYNETLESCEEYIYGGCAATLNNFDTKEECEKAAEMYCKDTDGKEDEPTSLQGRESMLESAASFVMARDHLIAHLVTPSLLLLLLQLLA
jgi:hypothetical protein